MLVYDPPLTYFLFSRPSIPTSLSTRASTRQLRDSPLTTDGNSMTPEGVASPQHPPITDREHSVAAMSNGASPRTSLAPQSHPKRPRGKTSHAFASPNPSPLTTRDIRLAPTGVKPEPSDDPFISHTDPPPPLEAYDSSFAHNGVIDEMRLGFDVTPSAKPALSSRRKGKGKDNAAEFGGDHEVDGYVSGFYNASGCPFTDT
jgi:hypothetical protein